MKLLSVALLFAVVLVLTSSSFAADVLLSELELPFHVSDRFGDCCKACGEPEKTALSPKKKEHNLESETTFDRSPVIRILTWSQPQPELQAYADLYNRVYTDAPTIRIFDVPSLKELDYEVTSELRLPSVVYDGFVVPPMFLGGMYQQRGGQALALWTDEDFQTQDGLSWMDDLLPYYKYNVATFDGKVRGLPILRGSQPMLLFRKDYLDAMKLPTPKTWEDWTTLAAQFANDVTQQWLSLSDGSHNEPVYGACLGLLSERACRKRASLDGVPCESQTMTYLGMILASMTQYRGNTTGYAMGIIDDTEPVTNEPDGSPIPTSRLDPLFQPTLIRILQWMEKHLEHSPSRSLAQDSLQSMEEFRDGKCAWTISMDHDSDLLNDDNIGFVPIPGSHLVLDRRGEQTRSAGKATSIFPNRPLNNSESMLRCSESCGKDCEILPTSTLCPYGKDIDNWGRVNYVPFGAIDATVGTVSGLTSSARQMELKKFFRFVLTSNIQPRDPSEKKKRQQPLTYSKLEKSKVANYANTLERLTSSPNAAIPFRVPNAFSLLSDLDERVYNYLLEGDYSTENREKVATAAEESWQTTIAMFDARDPQKSKLSTSFFYQQSLGVYEPLPASDLYIGWTARGVMWILAGLACLASVCLAVWVWRYTGERVIRASQPVFLYLICAGTFIMASSVITLGVEDDIASYEFTAASCMASYWLYSLGFTAVISALLSKIWILGGVLQKPRNEQRIQITKRDILVPFMIIFGIDFVILSIWTITDRLQWVRVPVHNDDLYSLNLVEESTVGWCMSGHKDLDVAFLLVFNYTILIVALVQSYECRRITTEYSESVWVTIAIATFAQAWVIGFPVVVLLGDDPNVYFIVRSSLVLFTACSVLALIFVPKMVYLYEALNESKHTGSGVKRRKDPKGTIGIRIIQSVYLDSDEIDELQDSVDRVQQRNKVLRATMERLKANIEEQRYARKLHPNAAFIESSSNRSVSSKSDNGYIIEAKPGRESQHHKKYGRRFTASSRDSYMS